MRTLQGKGMYVWYIQDCEKGDPAAIVRTAQAAGIRHVQIKVTDGIYYFNFAGGKDLVPPVISALSAIGVEIWVWSYVYGIFPEREAETLANRVRGLQNIAGVVINAEVEYKKPGMGAHAARFMRRLRELLPGMTLGLSSYRFPSLHPEFPWREFLSQVDVNMPQVYWMGATNPGAQLRRCLTEFRSLPVQRPIIPTGAAFAEHGWQPTDGQVLEFLQTVRELGIQGCNFWEWGRTRPRLAHLWDVIARFSWGEPVPAPEPPPQEDDMLIVKSNLNLRSAPIIAPNIITTMPAGEKLTLKEIGSLSAGYPWVRVQVVRTGQVGWCASVIDGRPSVQVL